MGSDIYAFKMDGLRRTFRCTFCLYSEMRPGDRVHIESTDGRITSVLMENGRLITTESVAPRRRKWHALALLLLALAAVGRALIKRRSPADDA